MMMHATTQTEADRLARNAEELSRARGILADAPHHSDTEIKTAVDAILTLTRDKDDLILANAWADILAHDQ